MKQYLLGIDIGTSGTKGILVDFEGRIISSCSIPHPVSMPRKCWAEHDAVNIWWSDFKKLCDKLFNNSKIKGNSIAAIGCSGLGPSMVPIDRNGNPLRPAILYGIDTRSKDEIKYLNGILGVRNIYETSGQILSAQSVGPKILWYKKNEPDKYKDTWKILTANGFIIYKLTGKCSIDQCSSFFFSPLFNIKKLCWDKPIIEKVGIRHSLLPKIYKSYDIVGKVTRAASKETGIAEGVPIIAGTVDTFAEAVGAGAVEKEDIYLSYGTTMTIIVNSKFLKTHENLWSNVHYIPDIYTLLGGTSTSGILTNWFIKNFFNIEQEIFKKHGINIYNILSDIAAKVSVGSDGLIVLPYFSGERTPINDELARGVLAGLTLSHTREHVYRAILEATGYSIAHHLDIINMLNIIPKQIIASGGGTENKAWTQIVSDITGLKQTCILEKELSAPIGDAYMAGYGTGIFKNFEILKREWIKKDREIEPDEKANKKYIEYFTIYKNIYKNTKGDIHRLGTL
jgi:xylulokinase